MKIKGPSCGHLIAVHTLPTKCCDHCWEFFFLLHKSFTQDLLKTFAEGREADICRHAGNRCNKYLKKLIKKYGVQQSGTNNSDDKG